MTDILHITNKAQSIATDFINKELPEGLKVNHIFIVSFYQDAHFNYVGIGQDSTINQSDRERIAKKFREYAGEIENGVK